MKKDIRMGLGSPGSTNHYPGDDFPEKNETEKRIETLGRDDQKPIRQPERRIEPLNPSKQ